MEKIVKNQAERPKGQTLSKVIDALRTGGLSLMIEEPVTPDGELEATEAKGFELTVVQSYVDKVQTQGPAGERNAAMLRGAFNDLLGQLEQSQNEGKV